MGAMMYECLAGRPPLNATRLAQRILMQAPAAPLGDDSPLERAVMAALSKAPTKRPTSCLSLMRQAHQPPPISQTERQRIEQELQQWIDLEFTNFDWLGAYKYLKTRTPARLASWRRALRAGEETARVLLFLASERGLIPILFGTLFAVRVKRSIGWARSSQEVFDSERLSAWAPLEPWSPGLLWGHSKQAKGGSTGQTASILRLGAAKASANQARDESAERSSWALSRAKCSSSSASSAQPMK
jgi:hypothetical protein